MASEGLWLEALMAGEGEVDLAGTHWQGGRRRGPAAQGLFWINSETQTQAGMTRVSDQNQW